MTVTVEGATRTIRANSLPNHHTGDFPSVTEQYPYISRCLMGEFTEAGPGPGAAAAGQPPDAPPGQGPPPGGRGTPPDA